RVMSNCGVAGVVPILDYDLADDPSVSRPWYAMPLGIPLARHLAGVSVQRKVEAVAQIAETIAALHTQGIAHRDIKPANLLVVADTPSIGDFGLVDYPDKADITGKRQEVGPRWTMAPEVRRAGATLDARPADVYSLAKTLWMLLIGNEQ